MSILLYVVGAILVAIGAVLIGFGIPINEFSFGNTLIVAGTVAIAGGVIVLALGVVVRELRHLADVYGRAGGRAAKAPDAEPQGMTRPTPPAAPARVPFPSKPKNQPRSEAALREPFEAAPAEPRSDRGPPPFAMTPPLTAPTSSSMSPSMAPPVSSHFPPRPEEDVFGVPALPNPEGMSAFDRDEVPDGPAGAAPRDFEQRPPPPFFGRDTMDDEAEPERSPFAPPRRPAPPLPTLEPAEKPGRSYFDSMWPEEAPPSEPASTGPDYALAEPPEPRGETDANAEPFEPEEAAEQGAGEEPRSVPILKSGVVDGMGYTLYVDGSIEAELPQGVLRFASINELRAHLEKTS